MKQVQNKPSEPIALRCLTMYYAETLRRLRMPARGSPPGPIWPGGSAGSPKNLNLSIRLD